jgi:hypothetical protein
VRRLIALGSLTGAPGVTTTACALAAAWPEAADTGVRPVVVETNVWGGDLAVRHGVPHALLDVAATARQAQPGSLLGAVAELPFGVRAVAAPAGRGACREAVRVLGGEAGRRVLTGEASDRGTVLLDLGRISPDVDELLDAADEVVLVTRGCPEALAHVFPHRQSAGEEARLMSLVVVGSCPYPAEEIAQVLGIERVTFLPWDPKAVTAMGGRRPVTLRTTGFRAFPLAAAAHLLARDLAGTNGWVQGAEGGAMADRLRGFLPQQPPEEGSWA